MDFHQLPAALQAAGGRVAELEHTFPPRAAEVILEATRPPRLTGALDATGRTEGASVLFGGGLVDYAAPVHKLNPYLDRGVERAEAAVLDLAEAMLAEAITL
jgi:hypothetical protein